MTHRGPFQPLLFCDSVILWFCDIESNSAWKRKFAGDRGVWWQEISKVHSQGYGSSMAEFTYCKKRGTKCCCFFFQCPLCKMDKPQSKQTVNYLSFLPLAAQFSGWQKKQLWFHMLYVFLKIFCIFWLLKVFCDSSCWIYKMILQLQLSFPQFFE